MNLTVTAGETTFVVEMQEDGSIIYNGQRIQFQAANQSSILFSISAGNKKTRTYIQQLNENEYTVWIKHHDIHILIEDEKFRLLQNFRKSASAQSGTILMKAPMPGLISNIKVQKDQIVEQGTSLVILEAMKMENELRSTVRGRIRTIDVKPGMIVEKDQVLLIIDVT